MTDWALDNAWLVAALPAFTGVIVGLVLRPLAPRWCGPVAVAGVAAAAVHGIALAAGLRDHPAGPAVPWRMPWLRFAPGLGADLGALVDPLSILLVTTVTVVSLLVHIYSLGYMKGDPGLGRYFALLNLFTASMLGLVLAPNLIQLYVFWELVGATSFFLIGFDFDRPAAVSAAKKAFIVTRFADLGLLIGVLVLGACARDLHRELGPSVAHLQPFDFAFLGHPDVIARLGALPALWCGIPVLSVAALLVFVGAAGKSAMFPLHIWLPDAMEGPTPVSALIHAATMVVAGIYLVARALPLFVAAPGALDVVRTVGMTTCVVAAAIGCTAFDLKRVLAYSTLSQLGYMMAGLGAAGGAVGHAPGGDRAALFHLFTHAGFKALLFLAAGSVLHATHTGDLRQLGGLGTRMPWTRALFAIGALALAGVPPLAGFWSKDEILAALWHGGHGVSFAAGLLVAGLTAFYTARAGLLAFAGPPKGDGAAHAHESPASMILPMALLAAAALVAGLAPVGAWLGRSPLELHIGLDPLVALPASGAAVVGLGVAWRLYRSGTTDEADLATRHLGGLYRALAARLCVDEAWLFVTKRVMFPFVSAPAAWLDRRAIDGSVDLVGLTTRLAGRASALWPTGQVQTHAAWVVIAATAALALLWLRGGW